MSRAPARDSWSLTLYVSGASPRSVEAIATIRRICDAELGGDDVLTVLDAADHPEKVLEDQVVAIPTLVKRTPAPVRRLIGNLSNEDRVRFGLGLGGQQPFTN
jgi:circadian clock protein KaiB